MIEVEQRGLLTQEEFARVEAYLREHTEYLNEDHKYVEYFIYKDKLLKVVRNDSQKNAVLSLKLNALGGGALFDETECTLPIDQFPALQRIIHTVATPDQIITGTQKRENFILDGVEVALKWSEDWGHHFELECMIEDTAEESTALDKIKTVAQKLNVVIMSEEEVAEFAKQVRANK